MQILNIAGYKFLSLEQLDGLRQKLQELCIQATLKGTILLSVEGININVAGTIASIQQFKLALMQDQRFADMHFHETFSNDIPFKHLKVKIKKEIITLSQPQINTVEQRAPSISPNEFKQWLDEKRDITILDTRNDYEFRFGTFTNAVNLNIADFGEFPNASEQVDAEKPIVMFCTGGIRCEKAALYMMSKGYKNVYQLDKGILGYFHQVGGAHYDGECFVFDNRISVDAALKPTGTIQCQTCQGPIPANTQTCHHCTAI